MSVLPEDIVPWCRARFSHSKFTPKEAFAVAQGTETGQNVTVPSSGSTGEVDGGLSGIVCSLERQRDARIESALAALRGAGSEAGTKESDQIET